MTERLLVNRDFQRLSAHRRYDYLAQRLGQDACEKRELLFQVLEDITEQSARPLDMEILAVEQVWYQGGGRRAEYNRLMLYRAENNAQDSARHVRRYGGRRVHKTVWGPLRDLTMEVLKDRVAKGPERVHGMDVFLVSYFDGRTWHLSEYSNIHGSGDALFGTPQGHRLQRLSDFIDRGLGVELDWWIGTPVDDKVDKYLRKLKGGRSKGQGPATRD